MSTSREPIPTPDGLKLQLAAAAGNEPETSFTEIRPLNADGRIALLERAFVPVRNFEEIATCVRDLSSTHNVFISAAPRTRHSGRADAVERCWALWVDCDTPESVEALRRFLPRPSIVVQTRPGRLHAWWPLRQPVRPSWAKRGNQRLARALHSDRQAVDAARILRPIGSLNHKTQPPSPVICLRLELDVYLLADVVGHLPDLDGSVYGPREAPPPAHCVRPDATLDGLCRKVREAQPPIFGRPGERNALLYWAASRLREHADAGTLDESEGREALRQAALGAGLGDVEIERTLHSALARRAAA
jgi:hypothetical protein